jgi:hypothetical protein
MLRRIKIKIGEETLSYVNIRRNFFDRGKFTDTHVLTIPKKLIKDGKNHLYK